MAVARVPVVRHAAAVAEFSAARGVLDGGRRGRLVGRLLVPLVHRGLVTRVARFVPMRLRWRTRPAPVTLGRRVRPVRLGRRLLVRGRRPLVTAARTAPRIVRAVRIALAVVRPVAATIVVTLWPAPGIVLAVPALTARIGAVLVGAALIDPALVRGRAGAVVPRRCLAALRVRA